MFWLYWYIFLGCNLAVFCGVFVWLLIVLTLYAIFCSRAFQRFAVKTNRTLENLSSKGSVPYPFFPTQPKYCGTVDDLVLLLF
jgi:hypothetical protein